MSYNCSFVRLLFLVCSFTAHTTLGQKVGIKSSQALACSLAVQQWDYGCDNKAACLCQNEAYLGSVLDCIHDRVQEESPINDAYLYVQNQCKYNGNLYYPFGKLDELYFNVLKNETPRNKTNQPPKNVKINQPVDITDDDFNKYFPAAKAAKRQYDLGTKFGCSLIGYWLAIGVFGILSNAILTLYPELVFSSNRMVRSIRQYFTLPALLGDRHGRPVKLLFKLSLKAPTRGQSIILFGYLVLNVVFLVIEYDVFTPNPFLVNKMDQHLRYLGNRTGIIAFTQLPLVVLFAGRNNILIKCTGWSYNTFQVYHRWVARMMIVHSIIHGVCFTWLAVIGHVVAYKWEDVTNWRAANIAVYISIFMFILSLGAFRSRLYEIFLFSHKCMYIIFIVGIARHCYNFGWMGWVYAAVGVHATERLIRFGRVIVSGTKNEAYAEIFDDDTFRLSVSYSKRWNIEPGQYAYVRILTKDLFWQAHPFSIYKSPTPGDDTIHFAIKAKQGATRKIAQKLRSNANNVGVFSVLIEGPYGVHAPVENYETVFLLAGGMGVTATYAYAQYLQSIAKQGQRIVFLWVIQNTVPLEWFGEEILSLVNQSNIEVQIYITRDVKTVEGAEQPLQPVDSLDTKSIDSDKAPSNEKCAKARAYDELYSYKNSTHSSLPVLTEKSDSITKHPVVSIYSLPNFSSVPLSSITENECLNSSSILSQQIQNQYEHILHRGRPNLPEEISKFMTTEKGSMAIVSCGPPLFIDYIRKSIVVNIKKTDHRVDYFEEAFSW